MGFVAALGAGCQRPALGAQRAPVPIIETNDAPSEADDEPLVRLRQMGARVRPWSPGVSKGARNVCVVEDGVLLTRGPSGVRWQKGVRAAGAFALRLTTFERLAQEEARAAFGVSIARIEHLGSFVCRDVKGSVGSPSQHALGDAIDVSAFVLRNGRRISIERDFVRLDAEPTRPAGRFLRGLVERLRNERVFGTILTPDYDRHHANHLHLDGRRWFWFGWPGSA